MDNFFNNKNCERCGCELKIRTMSWFNNQTICVEVCGAEEKEIKTKLKNSGRDLEGANISIDQVRRLAKENE